MNVIGQINTIKKLVPENDFAKNPAVITKELMRVLGNTLYFIILTINYP